MTAIAFDTLHFANKLKEAGMASQLADVQSEEIAKILNDLTISTLATKQDIQILKSDIQNLKIEIYAFTSKVAMFTVGILGGLQTIFHFIK